MIAATTSLGCGFTFNRAVTHLLHGGASSLLAGGPPTPTFPTCRAIPFTAMLSQHTAQFLLLDTVSKVMHRC